MDTVLSEQGSNHRHLNLELINFWIFEVFNFFSSYLKLKIVFYLNLNCAVKTSLVPDTYVTRKLWRLCNYTENNNTWYDYTHYIELNCDNKCNNEGKSVASFCCHLVKWFPNMFCKLKKKSQFCYNSATPKLEKNKHRFGILKILEFFFMYLTKF